MLKLGIKNRLPTSRLWEQECLALFVSLICVPSMAPIPFARFALSPVYYFVHKCCIPTAHTFFGIPAHIPTPAQIVWRPATFLAWLALSP